MEDKTLDIQDLFYVFKSRYKIIILCVLLCLIGGVNFTSKMKPSYQARIKIFMNIGEAEGAIYSTSQLQANASLLSTTMQFVKTEDFMKMIVENGELEQEPSALVGGVGFNISETVPIIDISYVSGDSEVAKKVVEAMVAHLGTGLEKIVGKVETKVLDNIKVIPSIPNKKKIIIVAALAGLILGIGIVLVVDYLDDRVRRKNEIEKYLGIPVVGIIPEVKENKNVAREKSEKESAFRLKGILNKEAT